MTRIRPNAVGHIYDGFIKDTQNAIKKYEEELISEVVRVTTCISPVLSMSEMEQILSCCAEFIIPELYGKRIKLFREALDHNADRFGVCIDYNATRFDIYQARYSAGVANQVRDISFRLKNELNILVLAGEVARQKANADMELSNLGDVIIIKPSIFGLAIDLKKLWRLWRNNRKPA